MQGRQLAVADCGDLLFHPSGSVIQGYDIHSGQQQFTLKAHMDAVNACCFNELSGELYTGGNDRQICTWHPLLDHIASDADQWTP